MSRRLFLGGMEDSLPIFIGEDEYQAPRQTGVLGFFGKVMGFGARLIPQPPPSTTSAEIEIDSDEDSDDDELDVQQRYRLAPIAKVISIPVTNDYMDGAMLCKCESVGETFKMSPGLLGNILEKGPQMTTQRSMGEKTIPLGESSEVQLEPGPPNGFLLAPYHLRLSIATTDSTQPVTVRLKLGAKTKKVYHILNGTRIVDNIAIRDQHLIFHVLMYPDWRSYETTRLDKDVWIKRTWRSMYLFHWLIWNESQCVKGITAEKMASFFRLGDMVLKVRQWDNVLTFIEEQRQTLAAPITLETSAFYPNNVFQSTGDSAFVSLSPVRDSVFVQAAVKGIPIVNGD